jgi:hypothetical protein
MNYQATTLNWPRLAEDIAQKLDPKKVYEISVEALTGKDGAFRLFHELRDRYAEAIGPRDKHYCKQLLKWRYGPHQEYARLAYDPDAGKVVVRQSAEFAPINRVGQFVTFRNEGVIVYLVSTTDYRKDELMSINEAIKDELVANGVDISDLEEPFLGPGDRESRKQ